MKAIDLLKRLRGFSTPFGGLSWNPPPAERDAAHRLMVFLYDRRVLYVPCEAECPAHVVQSVQDIRREITDIAKQFSAGGELELKLRAMRSACTHFLNRVQKTSEILDFGTSHGHWAIWEFMDALGQWRAFMAVYVGMIASAYNVEPPAFLKTLLPVVPESNTTNGSDRIEADVDNLIESFEALSPAERQTDLDKTNHYLASHDGRREFRHLLESESRRLHGRRAGHQK